MRGIRLFEINANDSVESMFVKIAERREKKWL